MNSRFPTVAALITAAIYFGFAVWLSICPSALLSSFGMTTSTPAMLTEIRAFYGGVELAIGLAILLLWKRGDTSTSLLVGGLPLACSAIGRCVGMAVDGIAGLHIALACVELIGAVTCMIGCYVLRAPLSESQESS